MTSTKAFILCFSLIIISLCIGIIDIYIHELQVKKFVPYYPTYKTGRQDVYCRQNKTVHTEDGELSQNKTQLLYGEHLNISTRKHLPDAIIAGAKKCGTTAIKAFLSYHPSVAMPRGEVHYFDVHYSRGIQWYVNRMPVPKPGQIVIEKTPGYFVMSDVPQKIYDEISPKLKIIFVLCEPVHRAVSDFVYVKPVLKLLHHSLPGHKKLKSKTLFRIDSLLKRNYKLNGSFESSILDQSGNIITDNAIVELGVYIKYLQNWLKVFPSSQIHIVDGEILKRHPSVELQSLEKFLNLKQYFTEDNFYYDGKKGFYCIAKPKKRCLGESKGRHHPRIRKTVLKKLKAYYQPFNRKLDQTVETENLTDHILNFDLTYGD
ncbi:heparan sulfate glucosamine 3-O-sulfotransferase 1-like [Glandiceps talaboti]